MTAPRLIDESAAQTGQGYHLTRVYEISGEVVRVRIERDAYPHQSFAVAEVLSADRTWTNLASNPVDTWRGSTPASTGDVPKALGSLASDLAIRAATILSAGSPATR